MALPATLVWENRPTNGTANAGGGFDPSVASPGTDFSQQDAVQVAYTDLVIDAVTNTDITSAASPFGATAVGNNITITSGTGFTAGIYNIRSVSGVIATMDRAVGTVGSTGGVGNLGGARSGFTVGTTTLEASLVAGNTVWVKKEAWNESPNFTVAGTAAAPIIIEGYNAVRGDAPTGANRPTNDRAGVGTVAFTMGATGYIVKHLIAKSAGTVGFSQAGGASVIFLNCRATANGSDGWFNGSLVHLIQCEADANTGKGVNASSGTFSIVGSNLHDNTSNGFNTTSNVGLICAHSLVEANGATGILHTGTTAYGLLTNLTVDGNTGASSDGFSTGSNIARRVAMNCIFSNNGRYGWTSTAGNASWADFNDYFGNATAARDGGVMTGAGDSAADPTFTNRAAGDFSIGTNLKALGFPGLFPGGLSTGYLDIGAVQRQEPAGGSGGGPLIGGRLVN